MAQAICVICGDPFEVTARLAKKAKVCTPKRAPHRRPIVRRPDGTTKREPCKCCRCVYHRDFVVKKQIRLSRDDYFDHRDIDLFLAAAKAIGRGYYLAFRIMVNGMLKLGEVLRLKLDHLFTDIDPCFVKVPCPRRNGRAIESVDLDCETVKDLKAWVARRGVLEAKGKNVFQFSRRTLQAKFRQACADAAEAAKRDVRAIPSWKDEDIERLRRGYTMECLRRGGIKLRAAKVKHIADLEALRLAARHESIETTRMFLEPHEERRVDFLRRVDWAK